ncbi:MAG: VOC family protein [Pseudomonadota bacterium]
MAQAPIKELFPLLFSSDVEAIVDWATAALGLVESWRAPGEDGSLEHAELHWGTGKVSINVSGRGEHPSGPSSLSLRIDDRAEVDRLHEKAVAAGARITQPLMESPVAYSFTAVDPDGNEWWVNAETGMLESLRADSTPEASSQ